MLLANTIKGLESTYSWNILLPFYAKFLILWMSIALLPVVTIIKTITRNLTTFRIFIIIY